MTLITLTLILHVVIGLIGVAASFMVVIGLLKQKLSFKFLSFATFTAFISYILSWVTGGYYYVIQYGGAVKPVIIAGPYPWAHAFFTEVKEHVFLFLPFLSLILFLMVFFMRETLSEDTQMKRILMLIALLVFLLGIYVTVSGMIMSGSVK